MALTSWATASSSWSRSCGLGVDVLQGGEDGDDLVATVVVEPDLGDGGGVEAKLGIEGDAHGGGLEDLRIGDPSQGFPRERYAPWPKSSRGTCGENRGKSRSNRIIRRTLAIPDGTEAAAEGLRTALEDLCSAQRAAPDDSQVCNDLAWMLATCPRTRCETAPGPWRCHAGLARPTTGNTGPASARIRPHWQRVAHSPRPPSVRLMHSMNPEDVRATSKARLELDRGGQPYRD